MSRLLKKTEMKQKSPSRFRRVVGLEYRASKQSVPAVAVQGDHLMADEIVRVARRFGIPVVERPELAQALSGMSLDEQIPERLYEAVAVVLREIERRDVKRR